MAQRIVDISVALDAGVASDPPFMRPEIKYEAHDETVGQLCDFFPGLTADHLPDREGWANEWIKLTTHNGTHVGAPWHYHSTVDGGKRAITIDEVPLEWRFQQAVII